MAASDLLARLSLCLAQPARDALDAAVALARERTEALYLVGGAVRDLLLGAAHLDLDLAVEGDAIALAEALGARLDARVVAHPRFGTASVRGEGFQLDLAQARSERYRRPGALPTVEPGSIAEDLARRDFTMNAMALRLTPPRRGELLDPQGGQADLEAGLVRVLHERSLQDDATRILRALRYAGRLRFRIEPGTAALLRRDVAYLNTIGGARVRHELERIAQEERVEAIVREAARLGVLDVVHAAIRPDDAAVRACRHLPGAAPSHRDALLFCLLLASAAPGEADAAIKRLALTERQAAAARGAIALRDERRLAAPSLLASEAVALLEAQPALAVEAFALVASAPAGGRARRFLDEWRFLRPRLSGRDLEALGLPPGPQIGAALRALRAARLDGRVESRDDEARLVEALRGRPLAEARRG
jgi:tRNA nucleotidyltransferase (CCA-adding enzyme)